MKKQAGFTIIELVVVIALLGILAAVALPRFINVTGDAHNAAVRGTAGGFAAGVALAKARAVVDNAASGASVQLDGNISVVVNNTGYPVAEDGSPPANLAVLQAADCVEVWDSVLQGNRPVASTGAPAPGNGIDYQAAGGGPNCTFTYSTQNTAVDPAVDRVITYNSENGNVDVTGTDQ
ncbi:Tfp pilus assembly protein FimT/FimU [Neptuniibacter sp. PT8_73]|uniref:pilus assembly FimT family protein n=1 Tax=unclassified Neptuniibacter TaxID=2630693 RepID=UPI0039F6540C